MTFYAGTPIGTFTQTTPDDVWTIVHNFGTVVNIDVVHDVDGNQETVFPLSITMSPDNNTTTVTFSEPVSGTARVVGLFDRVQGGDSSM